MNISFRKLADIKNVLKKMEDRTAHVEIIAKDIMIEDGLHTLTIGPSGIIIDIGGETFNHIQNNIMIILKERLGWEWGTDSEQHAVLKYTVNPSIHSSDWAINRISDELQGMRQISNFYINKSIASQPIYSLSFDYKY